MDYDNDCRDRRRYIDYCCCKKMLKHCLKNCFKPAYFNAVINGSSQDVPPEGDVRFLLSFSSPDFEFTPGSSTITILKSGVYRFDYEVTIRPNEGTINAAFAVALNNLEHPLSFFGVHETDLADTVRRELTGFFIAEVTAGTTVSLRNKAATTNILAGTGVDNQAVNQTAISIFRIA